MRAWPTSTSAGMSSSTTAIPRAGPGCAGLVEPFDAFRVDAASDLSGQRAATMPALISRCCPPTVSAAERSLNDAMLTALGWEPDRSEVVTLTSGDKVIQSQWPSAVRPPAGCCSLAIDTVFATDPTTVVASKTAPPGTLLEPVLVGEKAEGRTVLEAAQLIFTADEPPNYILICSGGSIMLLDRDRWGEGVYLAANLDDAVARNDVRAHGELAAIAALFSAEAINPGDDAQSLLGRFARTSRQRVSGRVEGAAPRGASKRRASGQRRGPRRPLPPEGGLDTRSTPSS